MATGLRVAGSTDPSESTSPSAGPRLVAFRWPVVANRFRAEGSRPFSGPAANQVVVGVVAGAGDGLSRG
jgi:hypothetical protein